MEALLEDFLVQTSAVEAGGEGELDVSPECLVRGCGPDALGIEPLIQHEALVERRVVEKDAVALDVDLAQTGVAADLVENLLAVE